MKSNESVSFAAAKRQLQVYQFFKVMNIAILTIFFFVSGCTQDQIDSTTDPAFKAAQEDTPSIGDIFVAGMNEKSAVYWKNVKVYRLEVESEFSHAEDIAVSGTDIFVIGMDGQKTCLWKNGRKSWLDNRNNSIAHSIIVKNDTTYIVGSVYDEDLKDNRPVLWKNGKINYLADAGVAFDICAVGNDIYVNGLTGTDACYWKNGQQTLLATSEEASYSYSIINNNQDIFIPGFYLPNVENAASQGGYWKNGQFVSMEKGDVILKLSFNKETKYSVGAKNKMACLWTDSKPQMLSADTESEGRDICVYNDDIYVVGVKHDAVTKLESAGYWKNGQWMSLGSANSFASASVAVKAF